MYRHGSSCRTFWIGQRLLKSCRIQSFQFLAAPVSRRWRHGSAPSWPENSQRSFPIRATRSSLKTTGRSWTTTGVCFRTRHSWVRRPTGVAANESSQVRVRVVGGSRRSSRSSRRSAATGYGALSSVQLGVDGAAKGRRCDDPTSRDTGCGLCPRHRARTFRSHRELASAVSRYGSHHVLPDADADADPRRSAGYVRMGRKSRVAARCDRNDTGHSLLAAEFRLFLPCYDRLAP